MESARIARLIEHLREAEAPVRILRYLAWPASVRAEFFARGADALPRVEYAPFDPDPSLSALRRFRRELGTPDDAVSGWLARQADAIESGARLLASAGTDEFLTHSRALFGTPTDVQPDETTSALGLARQFDGIIESLSHADLGTPPPACHLADGLAESMRAAVNGRFGDAAPDVIVVDELSANALAGPENIRIRRNACFTDRDVDQLIQHEAFVHVLTSLDGRAQPDPPILGLSHPGTTRTQ
ncbi:MAG: tyrosine/phenylalanine carboxypeptidase domain-containing protein, partial [Halofilum sp. (in: g-proteobacteria)]